LATTNVAVSVPSIIEQADVPTAVPDNEQPVSTREKAEPDTPTIDPAEPEIGLSVIDGMLRTVVVV
jgi:hypothetical protein